MLRGLNRRQCRDAIAARTPFSNSTGSLRGVEGRWNSFGDLNGTEQARYLIADPVFTVVSYDTPIAWYSGGQWYKVDQKFSQTTSCHWGMVPAMVKP